MDPFFYGDIDKSLFGIHHQPTSTEFQDSSIVICNPIGFEYGRSHSVIRDLAKKLSDKGYHVLRFDYFATGDSSGHSDELSFEQCLNDIAVSCDEIKTMSATRKVNVIGYRYGALLAAYASKSIKFNRLIMWDTVVDGEIYLSDLKEIHNKMLIDSNRFDLRFQSSAESTSELVGHHFPPAFRQDIISNTLVNLDKIKTKKIDVFNYVDCYDVKSLVDGENFLTKANIHDFNSQSEWKNVNKIESKILSDPSVDKIIEVVGNNNG